MTNQAKSTVDQMDMFNINGVDKLSLESVENREALIDHYFKNEGAICYLGHSGGKDSQACYELVCSLIPHDQIVVIHATLGRYEHTGVIEHIKANISHELVVVRNELRSLIDGVLLRGMWFSPAFRTCTSGWKVSPIEKMIRADMQARGATVCFNVTGVRAQESRQRSK
jgi:3'-phosphoadenosine 5'-phosphosulfate sulfotransferase (PAPS reductase)/FAD synthetase